MTRTAAAAIKVFWQPGCASCLRTKEFLAKHEVPFISVNVLEDGFQDLERFGLRQVPTPGRRVGKRTGACDVARIAGIKLSQVTQLPGR